MLKKSRSQAVRLLFIGNSFTQRNNLPGLLADLAAARGLPVKHDLISVGGASLRTHWNAGEASEAIATGGYDYVVLQEQSTLPVKNAQRMAENVRLFDEAIQRAKSKTVLNMTWAREHAPETQQAIASAYNAIGKERVRSWFPSVWPGGAFSHSTINRCSTIATRAIPLWLARIWPPAFSWR